MASALSDIVASAGKSAEELRSHPQIVPQLLSAIAAALDRTRGEIIAIASAETALTQEELAPEFSRMTGTLRMFADVVSTDRWRRPVQDAPESDPARAIGPNHPLRSLLSPLGTVAVFGASNFPLAYGVCGGDTASALAAGCGVVVKEHPAHPAAGRLIHSTAQAALAGAGASPHLIGYAEHTVAADLVIPQALVRDPAIAAVGFTGSRAGGMALTRLAAERPIPIPVFAEMGSMNPVLITPAAIAAAGDAQRIAHQLADSILARFGQQCTCPGLLIVPDAAGNGSALLSTLRQRFEASPPRAMLAPWIRDSYVRRIRETASFRGVRIEAGSPEPIGERAARPVLLACEIEPLRDHQSLREEIFGPAAIVVSVRGDPAEVESIPIPGSLTLSLFYGEGDNWARRWLRQFERIAGRVIFNGVPTGVRVADAMVHGGPFPATNAPNSTAVGPRAIERWCRPVCYQNQPPA